jgi:hypothetical protein
MPELPFIRIITPVVVIQGKPKIKPPSRGLTKVVYVHLFVANPDTTIRVWP